MGTIATDQVNSSKLWSEEESGQDEVWKLYLLR